jgi:hypothetical protein
LVSLLGRAAALLGGGRGGPGQGTPAPADPPADPAAATAAWLAERGVTLTGWRRERPADAVYDALALTLGDQFDDLAGLHAAIRRQLASGRPVTLRLADHGPRTISAITGYCARLERYAFLADYTYHRASKTLRITPQRLGHVTSFFTGGWFERYVHLKLTAVLAEAGAADACLANVGLELPDGRGYELDLFGLPGGAPLWVECKTGDYAQHVGRYGALQRRLGLPPARLGLVVLGLADGLARQISAVHGLTVTNERRAGDRLRAALGLAPATEPGGEG